MHRDKAWRRAQRVRKIDRVRQWMHDRGLHTGRQVTVEESRSIYADWARRRHSAPACCSGFCCGNQRRHAGPTLGEIRFGHYADWCLSEGDGSLPELDRS